MTDIKMVVFDLGGVLVELTGVPRMMEWTGYSMTEPEMWRRWVLSPAGHAFESGRIKAEEFAAQIMAEFGILVPVEDFLGNFVTWAERLYPGAEELVTAIKGRLPLGCLSNTNAIHWERIDRTSSLLRLFDHVFPSHVTGLLKPDEAAFLLVSRRVGLPMESIVYLDDSAVNVEKARACGMQAFRVEQPSGAASQLQALGLL